MGGNLCGYYPLLPATTIVLFTLLTPPTDVMDHCSISSIWILPSPPRNYDRIVHTPRPTCRCNRPLLHFIHMDTTLSSPQPRSYCSHSSPHLQM
ncbi:hypothetical protein J6590_081620 [Homalodisca vitripennis]|nr:hypothetical protein J6590_081620 [Homalodisca vitripennis]